MTKNDLFEAAHQYVARIAIVMGDSGPKIVGKWGDIEPIEDYWDIWMHHKDLQKGLSGVRINRAAETLNNLPIKGPVRKLTGELWVQVPNLDDIAVIAPLLGVRKYRRPSAAQIEAFKTMRQNQ